MPEVESVPADRPLLFSLSFGNHKIRLDRDSSRILCKPGNMPSNHPFRFCSIFNALLSLLCRSRAVPVAAPPSASFPLLFNSIPRSSFASQITSTPSLCYAYRLDAKLNVAIPLLSRSHPFNAAPLLCHAQLLHALPFLCPAARHFSLQNSAIASLGEARRHNSSALRFEAVPFHCATSLLKAIP